MADETKKVIISVSADTQNAQGDIQDLGKNISNLNNIPLDKPFKNFKTEIREAIIEAKKMEEQFGKNSSQFAEAGKKVANLKDRFGEFNDSIKAFNPDNKLQALIKVGAGGIQTLSGLTGAMSLFGGETGKATETIAKLQALMALSGALSSVDDIKNSFKDFSAVVLDSSAVVKANQLVTNIAAGTMKLFGVAAEESAIGFKVLRGAIIATGFGALIIGIGYAIENFDKLKEVLGFTTAAQEAYNKTFEDFKKAATSAIQKVNEVKTAFDLAKEGVISKKDALQKYNDTLGDAFGKTNDLVTAEKNLAAKADTYIQIMGLKAQANALFTLSAQESSKALLASEEDQTGFLTKAKAGLLSYFGNSGGAVALTIKEQQEGVKDAVEKANSSAEILQKKGEELLKKAGDLSKGANIKVDLVDNKDTTEEDKKAEDERKAKAAKEAALLKEEKEKLKQHNDEIKKINDEALVASTEASLNEKEKELALLDDRFKAEDDAIQKGYDAEIEIYKAQLKRKAITQEQYNNNVNALDIKASDAVVAITSERGSKQLEVEKKYNKVIADFIDGYQTTAYQQSRQKLIEQFDEKIKVADDKQKELLEKLKTQEVGKLDNTETLRKNTINTETNLVNVKAENGDNKDENGVELDTPETRVAKLQAIYDAEKDFKEAQFQEELAKLGEDQDAIANLTAKHNAELTQDEKDNAKARQEISEAEKNSRIAILGQVSNALNQASDLAGKSTVAGKALAVASTTIATYQAAMGAFKGMITSIPGPVGIALGVAAAAVSVATGVANVKKILAVKVPSKSGGGDAGAAPVPPPPTINSTMLDPAALAVKDVRVTNPVGQEPIKAYITNRDLQANEDKKKFLNGISTF